MLKNYSSEYESKMLTSDKVHVTGLELGMMRRESQKDVEGLKRLLLERKPVINHLQNNPCTQLVGKWRGKGDDVHFLSLVCVQLQLTRSVIFACLQQNFSVSALSLSQYLTFWKRKRRGRTTGATFWQTFSTCFPSTLNLIPSSQRDITFIGERSIMSSIEMHEMVRRNSAKPLHFRAKVG